MELSLLKDIFVYITNAPLFWGSMGFTTAIAMFVGATIFDGHIEQAKKGMVAVGTYVFMLLWVTILRVNDTIIHSKIPTRNQMAYAGVATIFVISFFWVFGVFIGVFILNLRERKKVT